MAHLILSGVGGSSNWLPFMLPLVAILAVLKGSELLRDWLHRRKLASEHPITTNDEGEQPEATDQKL